MCAQSLSHEQFFVTPWTVCSPSASSVHGIFQARILEWVAISNSRGSSRPRIELKSVGSPALAGRLFTTGANEKPSDSIVALYHTYVCV